MCSLSKLFLRLRPHHLLVNSHLGWVQVIYQMTYRVPRSKVLKMKTFSQLLWLAQLELEPVLQPDLHLSGNVATKRPRDLRKPDNKLHQCNIRADEKELPKLYGGQGAHNFTHQGVTHLLHLMKNSLFRTWPITTPTRRTSLLWTSSLESPLHMVSP